MLDELRTILTREGITTAAIIDDVYDDIATSNDIDEECWSFFRDDHEEKEFSIIKNGCGVSDPESRCDELRSDDTFIKFLWGQKGKSEVFQKLYNSFIERQAAGRGLLKPLHDLLFGELNLQGGTYDSNRLGEAIN